MHLLFHSFIQLPIISRSIPFFSVWARQGYSNFDSKIDELTHKTIVILSAHSHWFLTQDHFPRFLWFYHIIQRDLWLDFFSFDTKRLNKLTNLARFTAFLGSNKINYNLIERNFTLAKIWNGHKFNKPTREFATWLWKTTSLVAFRD